MTKLADYIDHPMVEQIFGDGIPIKPWLQNLLRFTMRFRTGLIVWFFGLEMLLWTGKVQSFYDYTQWQDLSHYAYMQNWCVMFITCDIPTEIDNNSQ